SDIVREETEGCIFAALSGPSHAEEVGLSMPTAITVACENKEVAEEIQDAFMSSYFRVYTNEDVVGAELGGALKNIIALGAGISDGVGYGDNAKAALMNRGIVEIARLGIAMGADVHTFFGLSGIGDLIVTCTSKHSRNWNAGYLIGQGMTKDEAIKKIGMAVEGIPTTYGAYELSKKLNVEMPIVDAMYNVLENDADVKETVTRLMLRDKKEEKL
ncbi:MAG TPA: glycerol-3-phosphate dehydrogenase, partial [Clostridiales bacterium]|nr:glycerol-3-phosphate dehydrogenase [Clostridiales bacterium]